MEPIPEVCCKALLFDLDGVLVDSTPAVARVWRRWAREHGFDPDRVAEMAHGRPSITTVRELLPDADHEAENRIVERREMEDLEGVVALRGALQLVGVLPQDRWVVVTSSTRPLAEVRLRAAGLPAPRYLITASDVAKGKPHPEPFLKAAGVLGVAPRDCLVLEDSPAGIRAGKQAGCRVIAVRTTMPDEALRLAGPDWVVDGCQALELVASRPGEVCLRL